MNRLIFSLLLSGILWACHKDKPAEDAPPFPTGEDPLPYDTLFTKEVEYDKAHLFFAAKQLIAVHPGGVFSYSPKDGTTNWRWNSLFFSDSYLKNTELRFLDEDSTELLVHTSNAAYAIDLTTGRSIWREKVPEEYKLAELTNNGRDLYRFISRYQVYNTQYDLQMKKADGSWQDLLYLRPDSFSVAVRNLYVRKINEEHTELIFHRGKWGQQVTDLYKVVGLDIPNDRLRSYSSYQPYQYAGILIGDHFINDSTDASHLINLNTGQHTTWPHKYVGHGAGLYYFSRNNRLSIFDDQLNEVAVYPFERPLRKSIAGSEKQQIAYLGDRAYALSEDGALMRGDLAGKEVSWEVNGWGFEAISSAWPVDSSFFALANNQLYKIKF